MKRRTFLSLAGLSLVAAAGYRYWPDEGWVNPCDSEPTPDALLNHDLVQAAWDGIDPADVWDCHTHLIGTGDTGSGIRLHPHFQNPLHPAYYLRYRFYLNAACASETNDVDTSAAQRFVRLADEYPQGAKFLLLALDYRYDESGRRDVDHSPFYVPNSYAAQMAASHPQRLGWLASVHPYREDVVEALEAAASAGACGVKVLPATMGFDPFSSRCDPFYDALVQLRLPLLTHAGHEYAVAGVSQQELGNPLLLRRPLQRGVTVIVAHCASEGSNLDIERAGKAVKVSNFELFTRLMDDKNYHANLYGDISALTQFNRLGDALKTLLQRQDWQDRLLNGSDYPLPGVMPLFSPRQMVRHGLINQAQAGVLSELRHYNPLLFDFVAKRSLQFEGNRFATEVFETRRVFDRQREISLASV